MVVEEHQVILVFQFLMTKEELLVQEEVAEQDMEVETILLYTQQMQLPIEAEVVEVVVMVLQLLLLQLSVRVVQDLLLLMTHLVILLDQVFGV
jgi:hypothetical protein